KKIKGDSAIDDNEVTGMAVSDETTATLRLLRLLAKHGGQLHDLFLRHFDGLVIKPWLNIIPQLFARLDHPEVPVQNLITKLLCKIGIEDPQSIVFSCLVGSNSAHNSMLHNQLLSRIIQSLAVAHPDLVSHVRQLISDLQKVTVLWEETWYKFLGSQLLELKNRLSTMVEHYD